MSADADSGSLEPAAALLPKYTPTRLNGSLEFSHSLEYQKEILKIVDGTAGRAIVVTSNISNNISPK